jgi:hypothetical protein
MEKKVTRQVKHPPQDPAEVDRLVGELLLRWPMKQVLASISKYLQQQPGNLLDRRDTHRLRQLADRGFQRAYAKVFWTERSPWPYEIAAAAWLLLGAAAPLPDRRDECATTATTLLQ